MLITKYKGYEIIIEPSRIYTDKYQYRVTKNDLSVTYGVDCINIESAENKAKSVIREKLSNQSLNIKH